MGDFAEFASKSLLELIQKDKTLKLYEDKGFHWSSSKICTKVLKMDGTIDGGNGEYGQKEMIGYFVNLLSRISFLCKIADLRDVGGKEEKSIKDVLADLEGKVADVPVEFRDVDFTNIFISGEQYWREHWRTLLSIFLDIVAMTAHFDSSETKLKCEPKALISRRSSIDDIKETTFVNTFVAVATSLGVSDTLQVLLNDAIETGLNLRNNSDVIDDVEEWTKKEKFDEEFGLSTSKAICDTVGSKQVIVRRLKSEIVRFGCSRSTFPILIDICKIRRIGSFSSAGTPDENADPWANDVFAECEN